MAALFPGTPTDAALVVVTLRRLASSVPAAVVVDQKILRRCLAGLVVVQRGITLQPAGLRGKETLVAAAVATFWVMDLLEALAVAAAVLLRSEELLVGPRVAMVEPVLATLCAPGQLSTTAAVAAAGQAVPEALAALVVVAARLPEAAQDRALQIPVALAQAVL